MFRKFLQYMSFGCMLANGWYYTRFYFLAYLTNYFKGTNNNPIEKTGYDLVFSDEFDQQIDWNKWKPCEAWGCSRENVIFKQSQVTQNESNVILTTDINDIPGEAKAKTGGIFSWNSFNTMYGYFETREKLSPKGVTYWPAFWLSSSNSWPPEIDVFELLKENSSYISMTLHWIVGTDGHDCYGRTLKFPGSDFLSKDYHIYACKWTEKKVVWYIDNLAVYQLDKHVPDRNMFVLINNSSDMNSQFIPSDYPMPIYIDYFRSYKKN